MTTTQARRSFGVLLQQYRAAVGLSQEELAERAGLSRRGISDLERGARRAPYPATVRRLAEALGLHPSEQAEFIAAARGRQVSTEPPPLTPRGRLPLPLTSLVGREQALEEVRDLLATTRLLTLTGLGGIGKTRLAVEAARQHPEAVFVDLAPVSDGRLIAPAVGAALGLDERPGVAWLDVLASNLVGRRVLLVLDNCEHLAAACADFTERLLRACPEIAIVATSRQPLGVAGEQLWVVPPLPTDHVGSDGPDAAPAAIRLFVERARLVQPDFGVDNHTVGLVTDICRQLDGLPLAIELAAARVQLLGIEGLRKRLDQRLQLLKSKTHGAPGRHRTLGAAIEWSYDLLSEAEQAVFRKLAVLASGWTHEAAEAICGDGPMAGTVLLDVLEQLTDKSLIYAVPEPSGSVRYRMLETVRQYARERLEASGEAPAVLRRHAEYFLTVAETAARDFGSANQARVLALLEQEHDNLRSALRLCILRQDAGLGLRLGGALAPFWLQHGHLAEGREWLMQVLALPGAKVRTAMRAEALSGAGFLALRQSDFATARALFEESLSIRRELGDVRGVATCLSELGVLADDEGEYASAVSLHEQSLAIWRHIGDPLRIAGSLNNLGAAIAHRAMVASLHNRGTLEERRADYALARRLLEEALAIRRDHQDLQWIAGSLMNLGYLNDFDGEYAAAGCAYEEGLEISHELRDRESVGWALEGFSMLAAAQGQAERALRLGGAAAAARELLGALLPFVDREVHLFRLPLVRRMLGEEAADAAWAAGRAWSLEEAIRYALGHAPRS